MTISADRVHRLNALVKALTHHQIRELRLSLEEVDLRCDIIAKLPLELSQIVLQHLPLYQVFQAQRVSQKWKQILSSAQTMAPLLQDWYTKREIDRGLQIPTGLSADSVASLEAKHIDAYRTGHAFTYARHEWECFESNLDSGLVTYADGVMAWVDATDSDFVKLLDLRTGQTWSFLPEARTGITEIATSSSMVAALGSGRCHVWNYRTGESFTLLLPSHRRASIVVSGESLAIRSISGQPEANSRIDVVTWTLRDQKTLCFPGALSLGERKPASGLARSKTMLDNKGESVLLFYWTYGYSKKEKHSQIHYIRTSLDGTVLARGVFETIDTTQYHFYSDDIVPKETDGQAVIWAFFKNDSLSELTRICYNFQKDRLEVRTQIVTSLRTHDDIMSDIFSWKNAAYFFACRHGRPYLKVIDLHDSTCIDAKMDFPNTLENFDLPFSEGNPSEVLLFGDETFFITAFLGGFCVWCFDPNVRLFNEDPAYTKQRKSNIERRLRSKQNRKDASTEDPAICELD